MRSIKFDELPQKADLRRPTVQTVGPTPAPPTPPTTAATTPSITLDPKVIRK